MTGRHLQRGQRAHIQSAQHRQRAIAERELRLPDGQQHVDHVGETVVQCVGDPSQRQRALGAGLSRRVPAGGTDRRENGKMAHPRFFPMAALELAGSR